MNQSEHRSTTAEAYHHATRYPVESHEPVSDNESTWPPEWTTTYYKSYPRFQQIALPTPTVRQDLFSVVTNRKSRWPQRSEPLSPDDYGALLRYGTGIVRPDDILPDGRTFRAIPSAGMRYPIETYAVVFHGDNQIAPGLYHYDLKGHALTALWQRSFTDADARALVPTPWIHKAAALIVFTAVFWRTQTKYGERGYRYALLEAGHIAQNMHLVAEALTLPCCTLGGTNDEELEKLLDVESSTESVVYALAVGK